MSYTKTPAAGGFYGDDRDAYSSHKCGVEDNLQPRWYCVCGNPMFEGEGDSCDWCGADVTVAAAVTGSPYNPEGGYTEEQVQALNEEALLSQLLAKRGLTTADVDLVLSVGKERQFVGPSVVQMLEEAPNTTPRGLLMVAPITGQLGQGDV